MYLSYYQASRQEHHELMYAAHWLQWAHEHPESFSSNKYINWHRLAFQQGWHLIKGTGVSFMKIKIREIHPHWYFGHFLFPKTELRTPVILGPQKRDAVALYKLVPIILKSRFSFSVCRKVKLAYFQNVGSSVQIRVCVTHSDPNNQQA